MPKHPLNSQDEQWFSSNFPRLFDLYLRSDKDDPQNYFDFEELFPIAYLGAEAYEQLEKTLDRLSPEGWAKLRAKALPYVCARDPVRGYQQLITTLDEARGYVFLSDEGHDWIDFVEVRSTKSGYKTPDLAARKGNSRAFLEVKTINESDDSLDANAKWRREAVMVKQELSDPFKKKLVKTINEACQQLNAHSLPTDRKIVLLVVHFDVDQKTSASSYRALERFIASQSSQDQIEVHFQATL